MSEAPEMTAGADTLAWEVFRADNSNIPEDSLRADFPAKAEYALNIAKHLRAAGYRKPNVLAYVVVDRDGKFIKAFGQDNVAAQEFAVESTGDCEDAGIDWDYRVAEIVEALP